MKNEVRGTSFFRFRLIQTIYLLDLYNPTIALFSNDVPKIKQELLLLYVY